MKTLQDLIKDLTGISVEEDKINEYLKNERLDLRGADLKGAYLCATNLKHTYSFFHNVSYLPL
ncbi:hypothetical protein [Spiroplasma phoeniceum]|uniref:Pentapeptide repeat-containing protein n=1 Tax=Spiroplasma phoeniceum P40 TaxID=1276259 RepID=A0A345DLS2_9MOLU|nr:hypothetical protein [Spiroplasma phoeniceum]AXF95160.1 hypothetical protein SDAV_00159 [Spiroplasma phoeniceum P40]